MTNKKILGLLGLASRARKISFGADSTLLEIKKNKVKIIVLAKDSSDRTKRKFTEIAEKNKIPIVVTGSIDELSKAIGKNNKAIVGVKDYNIAVEIEKINRGDVNG